MHSLTTSLDERLKENAKLYSVKLFKRVLKLYVRSGYEGQFVELDLRKISCLWVFFAILTPHDLNVICTVNV